ncbi:ABC transporter ATP-binding protein [Streptomyces flavofungini]|uniref:ABC transporter ATP-binding protein n=1 Tax=Streptomyces flavofungini TaxID=68200 RepID=A0ABS0XDS1_9ACTN|nr:ABC transporter ATP-binding protein [Streptomyces flavofungini]MBJ3811352.1 ABC transporter ATP-binding protein [Streptomyces flavofungini]GHC42883.1 ABC transporter [Streptomyces flavofungini]
MLEIAGLSHRYADGHRAVEGVELHVARGELVSIVGPSGCGKSTLLRCVAGLQRPSEGRIAVGGRDVDGVPDDLAVVFQDYTRSLFPWLTVRDNVALPLRRRGLARAKRRARAESALAQVGLDGTAGRYPWQLSGGMQQRVAIARALAYRPALLLMDEPFGSVDAQTREDLEDLLLSVRAGGGGGSGGGSGGGGDSGGGPGDFGGGGDADGGTESGGSPGMTILLVTHDIDESVYVGDRVVVLTGAPGRVHSELRVELPAPRDQIVTRGLPEFVKLRAEVGRAVRRP